MDAMDASWRTAGHRGAARREDPRALTKSSNSCTLHIGSTGKKLHKVSGAAVSSGPAGTGTAGSHLKASGACARVHAGPSEIGGHGRYRTDAGEARELACCTSRGAAALVGNGSSGPFGHQCPGATWLCREGRVPYAAAVPRRGAIVRASCDCSRQHRARTWVAAMSAPPCMTPRVLALVAALADLFSPHPVTGGEEELLPLAEGARVGATSVRVLREAIRKGDLTAYGRQRDRAVRRGDPAALGRSSTRSR